MGASMAYVWAWRKRPVDRDRKGMRCRVIVRGRMNSALIEFEDGARFVTSRNGLRDALKLAFAQEPRACRPGGGFYDCQP